MKSDALWPKHFWSERVWTKINGQKATNMFFLPSKRFMT